MKIVVGHSVHERNSTRGRVDNRTSDCRRDSGSSPVGRRVLGAPQKSCGHNKLFPDALGGCCPSRIRRGDRHLATHRNCRHPTDRRGERQPEFAFESNFETLGLPTRPVSRRSVLRGQDRRTNCCAGGRRIVGSGNSRPGVPVVSNGAQSREQVVGRLRPAQQNSTRTSVHAKSLPEHHGVVQVVLPVVIATRTTHRTLGFKAWCRRQVPQPSDASFDCHFRYGHSASHRRE